MKPTDVFDYFGNPTKAAAAIEVKIPSLYTWLKMGRVPWDRQIQIDGLTKGGLPVDPDAIPEYVRKYIRIRGARVA
jgi:hypothetical protein